MFFIHTLEGLYRDLSMEEIIHRRDIHGIEGGKRPSRVIRDREGDEFLQSRSHVVSQAERSYRESISMKNEFEPLLHAWQIMSSPVKTVNPGMKITELWNYSNQEGIRHFPVVNENKKLIGIISDRDILKRLVITGHGITNFADETAGEFMTVEVITAYRMTDIRRIALVMFNTHTGSMPILDDEKKLTGIITRSDILHALINYPPLKLWG